MHDYKSLENELKSVVDSVAQDLKNKAQVRQINELIDEHAEYGVAYDLLCYLILNEELKISPDIYERIVELGKQMKMEEDSWLPLAVLIQ